MEDRLIQCLNEIINSDASAGVVRDILGSVIELSHIVSDYRDVNDFENYINSEDFVEDVYDLFDVDINQ